MLQSPMKENWRPAVNWEGLYEVSDMGRVRRTGPDAIGRFRYIGHILSPSKTGAGYLQHCFHQGAPKKPKNVTVHSLVATTFIGPRSEGYQVNHKDMDKTNNNVSNLEYLTPSENNLHAFANGYKSVRGSRHGMAKLTEERVKEIRALAASGMMLKDIAPQFGVNRSMISRIVSRKIWRHVP